jgi:hypothetical protein
MIQPRHLVCFSLVYSAAMLPAETAAKINLMAQAARLSRTDEGHSSCDERALTQRAFVVLTGTIVGVTLSA